MSYDIDTEAIRRVARKIGSIATSVQDLSSDDIPAIERSLDGNFEGEAAKPLEEVLADLRKDVKGMGNGLKAIQQELLRSNPTLQLEVLIGSVRNTARMESVMATYKPDIVFHAAAHKELLQHFS